MPPFEVVGDLQSRSPFVFTCEHASNAIPSALTPSDGDVALLSEHWGWDIGAGRVASALVAALGGHAVLGGFSRLVIDLNRDPRSPDLILDRAHDQVIDLNRDVDEVEARRRLDTVFTPFHDAVDRTIRGRLEATRELFLLSIHSFTPTYRDHERREVEVGVLFDEHEREAVAAAGAIAAHGFDCRLNEPYTGKPPGGLIYSVARHGRAHDIRFLELEIRQDLIDDDDKVARVTANLADALGRLP